MATSQKAGGWTFEHAAHLLRRAGFGGSPEEIDNLHKRGREGAVEFLIEAEGADYARPDWAQPVNRRGIRREMQSLPEEERREKIREVKKENFLHFRDLIQWWLGRMQISNAPLREKMTLFWHGHFATGFKKVKSPYLMWQQNETLRREALGNFGILTKQIAKDPAMLIWLDTAQSKKKNPNENFARELMELFTLGIGNYSEGDIREAARAFTGYRIQEETQQFKFVPFLHDDSEKMFFGRKEAYTGDGIIDRILQRPACAEFITKKIWEFFVYENPPENIVAECSKKFRSGKYEIKPLLKHIFLSAEFYSGRAYRNAIKSPVQFLVQMTKELGVRLPDDGVLVNALRQMGQVPFDPPNVKGWDGGKAWITTSTLLFRYNYGGFAIGHGSFPNAGGRNKKAPKRSGLDLEQMVPVELRDDPKKIVDTLARRLFQAPLTSEDAAVFERYVEGRPMNGETLRGLIHLLMSTPQYQLI